jgi:hypothetical protein
MIGTDVDRTGRRDARRLALDLAVLVGRPASLVVLADPVSGGELARASAGHPPAVDGEELLELVLPSEPVVCDAARVHNGELRRLACAWRVSRLLIVPCLFGNDLVALAVAPLGDRADARAVLVAARCQAERFAARVTATRLFGRASLLCAAS